MPGGWRLKYDLRWARSLILDDIDSNVSGLASAMYGESSSRARFDSSESGCGLVNRKVQSSNNGE